MKLFFITFLIVNTFLFCQTEDVISVQIPDTLIQLQPSEDTLAITSPPSAYDVDTVIYANATDSLIYFIKEKKMAIYGQGELRYKETELKAANIMVDFSTSNIDAEGIPSDTLEGQYTGTPVLKEGIELYESTRMKYNFKTQRGFMAAATTESDGGFYTGTKIKKIDKDTYFIEDGIYTTCDESCPHYHFYSPHMKVIHKEQLIAEWIWLHFGGVPFPIPLPFAVFPIESGRRSGILPPAFGEDGTYGRYFSRFGYFWAISDYMDWAATGDYYTRGSYNLSSRFRYAKRYNFTGNLEGGYSFFRTRGAIDPDREERRDWRVKWNHNQSITPTMRFDANLEFISGNYLRRNVADFNELLRNEVVSNATFFESWEEAGNSMSVSYSRRQVLETGDISETLPNLSFNMSQKYPFRRKNALGEQEWYELIGYNYSGQFQNTRNKTAGDLRVRGGIQHNVSVGASPKIGYFSISPNIRYQERWYNKRIGRRLAGITIAGSDSVVTDDVHQINMVRTFGVGLSASTKFYGMFLPEALGISAIRHTVNPTISYNYQPDFSKPFWGYFDSYFNSKGEEVRYNKFEREIFGGPGIGEQQSISLSVSNIFEMKTHVDPTDTTSKENKIQLLNLTGSMGYNFAADSLRLSDLNINYRTQVSDLLNLSGSTTFTPYSYADNVSKINRFLIDDGRGLLRMTSFSLSLSTSISGERLRSKDETTPSGMQDDPFQIGNTPGNIYQGLYQQGDPDFSIPWDISLNYNFSQQTPKPGSTTKFSSISGSLNFNLTPNWKFSFTGNYDLTRKEFSAPQVRISRDLHCWIMNFTWNPIGTFTGYMFEIRVKAPQLQDLKVTKRDQFYTGR